jgi:hypothetical protein
MVSDARLQELIDRYKRLRESSLVSCGKAPAEVTRTANDIEECLVELQVRRDAHGE